MKIKEKAITFAYCSAFFCFDFLRLVELYFDCACMMSKVSKCKLKIRFLSFRHSFHLTVLQFSLCKKSRACVLSTVKRFFFFDIRMEENFCTFQLSTINNWDLHFLLYLFNKYSTPLCPWHAISLWGKLQRT